MKNQFNLNIKTPCQENFNHFSSTQDGGFCSSCEKEVIDFTTMNANEIISYFKTKVKDTTCGRFNSKQLKTYEPIPEKRKYLSILSGIGLACFSLLSFTTAQAQENNTKENTSIAQLNKNMIVKGTITDEYGFPLPYVNILLKGTTIGTAADENGGFQFPRKLQKGDVLLFSYVGYTSQKIVIEDNLTATNIQLKVAMNQDDIVIMGKVATKEVYKSKRNK